MKKITKIRWCDWCLLVMTLLMLFSGIQLEITGSESKVSVWVHILVGILFFGLAGWHIWLHFGLSDWFARFSKQKSPVTRILWWVSLITLLSAAIATGHWLSASVHSPIGAVHGKIGFLMILLASGHIIKRIRFFRR